MQELKKALLDTEPVMWLVQYEGFVYLLTIFVVLFIAKMVKDWFTPYSLKEQLTKEDNKAVAVAVAGYLLGVMIILLGIFNTEAVIAGEVKTKMDLGKDLLSTIIWGAIGIILLNLSQWINDRFLLRHFDNTKELITDKNVGTGAVIFGSYIGSALIVQGAVYGESNGWVNDIASTLLYFVLGQIALLIFGAIYQKMSRYDVHAEIEKDNIAAGVAFGLSLVAISILLSGYLAEYSSLAGFGLWFIMGMFVLVLSRYIADKTLLPGDLLDEEISKDQNWGAALVEGAVAIGIALIMVPAFLS